MTKRKASRQESAPPDNVAEGDDATPARPRRDHGRPIRVLVNDAERAEIERLAGLAGMPPSSFVRAAALGAPIRSAYDYDAVVELVKVSGDLGRLGGLLKLWLTERRGELATVSDMNRLLKETRALQEQMRGLLGRV